MSYTDNFEERRDEALELLGDDGVVSYHVAVVKGDGEARESAFLGGHKEDDAQQSSEINDRLIGKMLRTYADYTGKSVEAVAESGIERAGELE